MTNLNAEQERAVQTTEGPLLIIAGAGAGKTRVITHRILNLIKKGVAPGSILAITFTNKAAKEMRERVGDLLLKDTEVNRPISTNERPFVSTFHALGVHIIRENASLLGLSRHFTIYDRSDSRRAIKDAMAQCSIDPKAFEPGTILGMISRAKGDAISKSVYRSRQESVSGGDGFVNDVVVRVWEKYEAILAHEKALDFDDLLFRTAELLEKHAEVRRHYQALWKYIHIDEYQDTNRVQYRIATYLADGRSSDGTPIHNICVVGDADQNIYSWRGATMENILNFEKDYPEAQTIALETNYRSTKTIIAAANNIIGKNVMRIKKTLRTDNPPGEKITVIASYSEDNEAQAIADEARKIISEGVSAREIAVLYRTNFQSRALEESFIKKNIPYQLLGTRFFDRKEVKDVLSYIRAALNPDGLGDIGRIINVPPRGIGKVTVAKLFSGREDLIPETTRIKIAQFRTLLTDIHAEITEHKPSETLKFVIRETGIERILEDDEEGLFNVRELVSVAAHYDHLDPERGIEALLENAALATDQDELVKDEEAVKLMTVHAAKGLEFEYVFVAGLEEDLFPLKHMDDGEKSPAESEEERRLFYVAITRAKKKLYLSYTIIRTIYGSQKISAPSSFIADIDATLIQEHAPEKPSGAKALFIDF